MDDRRAGTWQRYWLAGGAFALTGATVGFLSCRPYQATSLKETVADDPRFAALQLTMDGNPKTGEIVARFSYQGSDFQPGEQVKLVYDVVSNGTGAVNCSALRKSATVELAGAGQEGRFSVRVSPKEFESPIQPHPQGLAKFDTTREDAVYNGPMKVEGCFVQGDRPVKQASTAVTSGFALAGEDGINGYAKICAEKLGPIPAFSCLDDELFKELPVTATHNGTPEELKIRAAECDRPIYLPTGGNSNCKPWARIGKIKTSPTAYAAVVCRRYWPEVSADPNPGGAGSGIPAGGEAISPAQHPENWKRNPSAANDPFFNDVAIIQADTKTGETCFFQALGTMYAGRVPPPDEPALPAEVRAAHPKAKNAESFWLAPSSTAGINCINCHDSDPWMHSPYVRQVLDTDGDVFLPSKPLVKKYVMLGGEYGFNNWTTSYSVASADGATDACTSCHKIGSLNGCESWASDIGTGVHFAGSKTRFGKDFEQRTWMPPDHGEADQAAWDSSYKEAVDAIERCCNVPGARLGITSFFGASRYGRSLSPEKIAAIEAAGCTVTPRSSVVMGTGATTP